MKKADWRYLVDVVLFICLGGMVFIGILLGLVIPSGPAVSDTAKFFLGLHRHQWGDIHAYLSIAFVVFMVIHLILNWDWITVKTRQIFKEKVASTLVVTACLPFFVLFLFWLFTPKDSLEYREYGIGTGKHQRLQLMTSEKRPAIEEKEAKAEEKIGSVEPEIPHLSRGEEHHHVAGPLVITGRNTLFDIERATGISGRKIAERLGLPSHAPLNETLGRLRRLYGFEIQDVRDVVEAMLKEDN